MLVGNGFDAKCKNYFQRNSGYKKIANKYFDKLVRDIRSKYNAELVSTNKSIQLMAKNQEEGILCMYGLASDQSPKTESGISLGYFHGN